ncbi:GNAT family N-acetyltransferase [Mycoplasma sp. P36-A1]|uniref:GNAT family N-acetyltransferase n=1 Tax=Mycoplasma sp. P36-A1 TaxID=3252900 RepID=UPI003C303B29
MFLETKRLYLRKMTLEDQDDLDLLLKDTGITYAYEHDFTDEDVVKWIEDNIQTYEESGYGLMAVILKENDRFIGQAGLVKVKEEEDDLTEVFYLLKREYWHNGYAIEAARALSNYAFDYLNQDKVYAQIRFDNYPSKNVAKRLGMKPIKLFNVKVYGTDIMHDLYEINKTTFDKNNNI